MSRWEVRLIVTATLLVGGTGVVYGWMRYFLEPAEPWDLVNHPLEPHLQHLHILLAPLLVFACGLIWKQHVVGRSHRRRKVGDRLLLWSIVPMIVTGPLIQVATQATWRRLWIVAHVASSLVWLGAFGLHQWQRRRNGLGRGDRG